MSLIFICNPCKTFSVVVNFRPTLSLTHMTQRCERSPRKGEKIVADVAKGKSVPAKLDQALRPSSGPAPAKPAPAVEVVKFQKPAAAKPAAAPAAKPTAAQPAAPAYRTISGNKQQLQDRRVEEVVRVTQRLRDLCSDLCSQQSQRQIVVRRDFHNDRSSTGRAEWVESVGPKNALAAAGAVASYAKVYGAATVAYASASATAAFAAPTLGGIRSGRCRRYWVALGLSRRPGLQVMQ